MRKADSRKRVEGDHTSRPPMNVFNALSRRRFLHLTGAVMGLSPLALASAGVTGQTVTSTSALNAPPPRKPSTNDVFPGVRRERAWIPMKDGVHLSAELWIPENASREHPVPPVWEYAPYRLDDNGIHDMYEQCVYVSQHGIAAVRVDMRGTGASQGVLPPTEYSEEEMQDGLEVIDWLSKQP